MITIDPDATLIFTHDVEGGDTITFYIDEEQERLADLAERGNAALDQMRMDQQVDDDDEWTSLLPDELELLIAMYEDAVEFELLPEMIEGLYALVNPLTTPPISKAASIALQSTIYNAQCFGHSDVARVLTNAIHNRTMVRGLVRE